MPAHGNGITSCNFAQVMLSSSAIAEGFDQERVKGVKVLTFGRLLLRQAHTTKRVIPDVIRHSVPCPDFPAPLGSRGED